MSLSDLAFEATALQIARRIRLEGWRHGRGRTADSVVIDVIVVLPLVLGQVPGGLVTTEISDVHTARSAWRRLAGDEFRADRQAIGLVAAFGARSLRRRGRRCGQVARRQRSSWAGSSSSYPALGAVGWDHPSGMLGRAAYRARSRHLHGFTVTPHSCPVTCPTPRMGLARNRTRLARSPTSSCPFDRTRESPAFGDTAARPRRREVRLDLVGTSRPEHASDSRCAASMRCGLGLAFTAVRRERYRR